MANERARQMQKYSQRYGKAKAKSMKGQGKCRNIDKGMARQRQSQMKGQRQMKGQKQGKRQKVNDRAKANAEA